MVPKTDLFGFTMIERLLTDFHAGQGNWPANLSTQAIFTPANHHAGTTATPSRSGWVRFEPNLSFGSLNVLRNHSKRGNIASQPVVRSTHQPTEATADAVICRQCRHAITASTESRVINGAHAHTFANPEGIVYEIVCYRDAWGCGYVGPASPEFTWFSGYVWRIAVCANCHAHLGWRFNAPDGRHFHGLIASRIVDRPT